MTARGLWHRPVSMNANASSSPQGEQTAEIHSSAGQPPQGRVSIRPECFRLPSGRERDPHFGLGRSYWNGLILATPANDYKPKVKSYVIRRRGSRTGVRLIDYDSAMAFIKQHQEKFQTPTRSVAQPEVASEDSEREAPTIADRPPRGCRR